MADCVVVFMTVVAYSKTEKSLKLLSPSQSDLVNMYIIYFLFTNKFNLDCLYFSS